jgi:glycerophosphoryl diester phosphodiesterase
MQVIAHRGASKAERENTVAAFRLAASMGADAVELDVRRSRDGVLVVHHDAHRGGEAEGGHSILTLRLRSTTVSDYLHER